MPWLSVGPEVLPVVVFLVSFLIEPRKFRTGLYLFVALAWVAALVLGWSLSTVSRLDDTFAAWWLLGLVVVAALTITALAVFMVVAGITLVRREGLRPGRLLSLVLGLMALGALAWLALAIKSEDTASLAWLVMIGLPASYFGVGFVAFVIYGRFYPAWMARFGPPAEAVIVLGSGLINGKVPPLLARRLQAARRVFADSLVRGRHPVLIASGGQGADEPIPEAVAMREFLVEDGLDASQIVVEDQSRNTQQNLAFSAEVLQDYTITGPVAVVTSDFHALRAAFLMRSVGISGYAVGARTPRYFWATAVIREYAAVLRDHFWLNAVPVALSCVPLGFAVVSAILNRLG